MTDPGCESLKTSRSLSLVASSIPYCTVLFCCGRQEEHLMRPPDNPYTPSSPDSSVQFLAALPHSLDITPPITSSHITSSSPLSRTKDTRSCKSPRLLSCSVTFCVDLVFVVYLTQSRLGFLLTYSAHCCPRQKRPTGPRSASQDDD
jgi:hypothetical protein